jgi:hypothetical protein
MISVLAYKYFISSMIQRMGHIFFQTDEVFFYINNYYNIMLKMNKKTRKVQISI